MKFLAIAAVLALLPAVSRADSNCASGVTFATVIAGGPCVIGNAIFNLTENVGNPYESTTIFTPFTTDTSAGFTFTGAAGTFFDTLYVTPLDGYFTSYSCTTTGYACFLYGNSGEASDVSGSEQSVEVPDASLSGQLEVENPGTDTFTFNESDPGPTSVPEGSELAMLGISVTGIFGAMKRRSIAR